MGLLAKSELVWIFAGFGLILFLIQAVVKAMTDPKNKYEIPPVKIPALEVEFIATGSPPGKITCGERLIALVKPWAWHVFAAVMVALGFAADYTNAHIGWVDGKYGGWVASAVFGVTGLIRSYQLTQLIKQSDTRQVEIK